MNNVTKELKRNKRNNKLIGVGLITLFILTCSV